MVTGQSAAVGASSSDTKGDGEPQTDNRANGEVLTFGAFTLAPSKRIFRSGEAEVPLGDRAFDLLALLVRRAGEVISKREILEHVWPGMFVDEANLRAQIAHLRTALGDDPERPTQILNVRGRGYVFTAEVQRPLAAPPETPADPVTLRQRRLPRRCQRLLGREQALDHLVGLAQTSQLTTIVGPGGLGKTVLAVEIGHSLAANFGDDVCFVDLGSLNAADLVLPTIASALGYSIQADDLLIGLAKNVADRNVLLILDCCEHVLEEVCEITTVLLRHTSRMHILATSRETLRSEAEHVYLLPPLDFPTDKEGLSADEAGATASVQLFMERASSRGYVGELHDANAATLAEICRHLDGVPLAIEMVASRLTTYGFSGLLEALSGRSVLRWPGRRNDARHQSLQATLDWSFELLSPDEQRVLSRLSILSGSFSLADAQAVACLGDDEPWAIVRAIEGLADKSLLALSTTEGLQSFRLLDVTRLYAGLKLDEGQRSAVAFRHAQWCAALLASLYPLGSDDAPPDRRPAERALGNLRPALEWSFSADGDIALGIELAACASRMFLDLSMHGECVRWCGAALNHVEDHDPVALPILKLQENLALSLMFTVGNHERVGDAINKGLEMAVALGARQTQLHLLAGSNLYHTRRGDYPSALIAAERFADVASNGQSPAEMVAADWMLGATYYLIGQEVRGEELLARGYALAQASGERPLRYFGFDQECRAAMGRVLNAWLRGKPEAAVAFLKQCLAAVSAENHPVSMCIAYLYASWLALWLRDVEWGQEVADVVQKVAEKHQLKPYLTASIALRGELLLARGQVEAAVEVLASVAGSLRDDRQHIVLAPTLRAYADGLRQLGQIELADEIITGLVNRAEGGTPTFLLPEILRTRGDICLARGPEGVEAAEAHYSRALAEARTSGALGWELRAATSLARLWIGAGRTAQARVLLRQTLAQFSEGHDTADLREAQSLL